MTSKSPTVHLVSLGCPKNRVDSEVMLGHLGNVGYQPSPSAEQADVIVVNTCSFIDAAKEESVDVILEMAKIKAQSQGKKLVVTGCLSQRYAPELSKEIPEVDHFLGTGNFETIAEVLGHKKTSAKVHRSLPILGDDEVQVEGHKREHGNHQPHARLSGKNALVPFHHKPTASSVVAIPDPDFTLTAQSPRIATLPAYTAYLKVSEGCSNTCAFCIIPKLRGPQRSRSIDDVLEEAEQLVNRGAVEINLIAQDLCAYGKDREPKQSLAQLLRALDRLKSKGNKPLWIRCLYAYPKGLTKEVMEVMAEGTNIIPYLDMPLQHISDSMLRRMRRGKGGEATWELVRTLRKKIPNLILRTTFITGMPGETEEDFLELCRFVEEIRFERMGVFAFSPEEDTPAADMAEQVSGELAAERRDRLMDLQRHISGEQQRSLIGKTLDVLVEGLSEETDLLLQGRHMGQAPDIDGVTYINSGQASAGDVVRVNIEEAHDYDLVGGISS